MAAKMFSRREAPEEVDVRVEVVVLLFVVGQADEGLHPGAVALDQGEDARVAAGGPLPGLAAAGHGPLALLRGAAQALNPGDAPEVAVLDRHQQAARARVAELDAVHEFNDP
eukprot:8689966-Lingulodinium_polyedra.AAC.1